MNQSEFSILEEIRNMNKFELILASGVLSITIFRILFWATEIWLDLHSASVFDFVNKNHLRPGEWFMTSFVMVS